MHQNPAKESEAVSVVTSLLHWIERMLAESSFPKQKRWSSPPAAPRPPKYAKSRLVQTILFDSLVTISER